MQRKVSKEKFYNAGKSKTSQDLVHQHMSNHYRKILNAKKTVDNGPPHSYKAKRPATSNPGVIRNKLNRQIESPALTDRSLSTNSNKGSCWGTESYAGSSRYHARCIPDSPTFAGSGKRTVVDMELVDRITYDTKNGPASYCGEGWMGAKSQQNDKSYKTAHGTKQNRNEKCASPTAKRRLPTMNTHESAQKRKFAVQNEAGNSPDRRIDCSLDVLPYKCSKISVNDPHDTVLKKISFNPKEQSLTSSRDSAYNGGVSSLPESRSPTPDERKKKECCCCCCKKKQRDAKLFESTKTVPCKTDDADSSKAPKQVSRPSTPISKPQNQQESLKKIQEDELYVKFIQDITTEVLEKNLYTNKALKNVMKRHIKNNLIKLNKDRMLREVEYLRVQLGIPEDESLLQVECEPEESEVDAMKSYPIISDSEFVMPRNVPKDATPTGKMSKREIADASSVTGDEKAPLEPESEDDRETLSVIQVTKAVREKRKEKSAEKIPMVISRENSFDDSDDRSFDPKTLSVFKNLKKKVPRTDSSSSSSSDSEIFTRKVWEKTKGKISGSEELLLERLGQNKKNRNVSFWKNPELDLTRTGRTIEINQKKTTIRSKESVLHEKKEKSKND